MLYEKEISQSINDKYYEDVIEHQCGAEAISSVFKK